MIGRRPLPARVTGRRPRAHPPLPVRVVAVPDDERERSPKRHAVAKSRENVDLVGFELLPRTAPVALTPTRQIEVDRFSIEPKPGREPGDDSDECRAVRLTRGRELERHVSKPMASLMTSTGAARPVQSSNAAAPCARSTSRPGTTSRAGPARGSCCRRLGVREIDERLAGVELDHDGVSFRGRVDHEVGVREVGWPCSAAREPARVWESRHEGNCRSAVTENRWALERQAAQDRRVGRQPLDTALADDERVHGRNARCRSRR